MRHCFLLWTTRWPKKNINERVATYKMENASKNIYVVTVFSMTFRSQVSLIKSFAQGSFRGRVHAKFGPTKPPKIAHSLTLSHASLFTGT